MCLLRGRGREGMGGSLCEVLMGKHRVADRLMYDYG